MALYCVCGCGLSVWLTLNNYDWVSMVTDLPCCFQRLRARLESFRRAPSQTSRQSATTPASPGNTQLSWQQTSHAPWQRHPDRQVPGYGFYGYSRVQSRRRTAEEIQHCGDTIVYCGYPGCNKGYNAHRNLLRHQRVMHDRNFREPALVRKEEGGNQAGTFELSEMSYRQSHNMTMPAWVRVNSHTLGLGVYYGEPVNTDLEASSVWVTWLNQDMTYFDRKLNTSFQDDVIAISNWLFVLPIHMIHIVHIHDIHPGLV